MSVCVLPFELFETVVSIVGLLGVGICLFCSSWFVRSRVPFPRNSKYRKVNTKHRFGNTYSAKFIAGIPKPMLQKYNKLTRIFAYKLYVT